MALVTSMCASTMSASSNAKVLDHVPQIFSGSAEALAAAANRRAPQAKEGRSLVRADPRSSNFPRSPQPLPVIASQTSQAWVQPAVAVRVRCAGLVVSAAAAVFPCPCPCPVCIASLSRLYVLRRTGVVGSCQPACREVAVCT